MKVVASGECGINRAALDYGVPPHYTKRQAQWPCGPWKKSQAQLHI